MYKSNIYFTEEEMNKVQGFAKEIAWKHPHFLDKKNKEKRTLQQVEESVLLGKLAEIAVHRYLTEHFGNDVSDLDFGIYPQGVQDDHDIMVNGVKISIKSSKPNSSILMIESAKFLLNEQRQAIALERKTPPDVFLFLHVDVPEKKAMVCGGISFSDFWRIKRFMPRGIYINRKNARRYFFERCPASDLDKGKGSPLLADNYGMHIEHLHDPLFVIQNQLQMQKGRTA